MKRSICTLIALALLLSAAALAEPPAVDRAGNAIAIPGEVARVISLAPATTEILDAIGARDRLVAVDSQSPLYVDGLDGLPRFDMMAPDVEGIAALQPDIVYTTGMSYIDGNPYQALIDLGVCVIEIPSGTSVRGVAEDIVFTAACVGMQDAGEALAQDMLDQIDALAAVGATIGEKRSVLFEISALPYIYSCGSGTFIDEMIGMIGAVNVFGAQAGWLSVTEEDAVASNPDVILTSVNYLDDAVAEILARPGWGAVTAVANGDVYYIDNAASSLPDQNIVRAMREIALAVYPEAYADFADGAEP